MSESITARNLWEKYRQDCCEGECGELLNFQRLAFLAGVLAATGAICIGIADPVNLVLSTEQMFEDVINERLAEHAERN